MVRNTLKLVSFVVFLTVLIPMSSRGQQVTEPPSKITYPTGQAGVYVQDTSGWRLLSQSAPSKVKVKHGFVSSLS